MSAYGALAIMLVVSVLTVLWRLFIEPRAEGPVDYQHGSENWEGYQ